jgi:hypothetical protein
MVYVDDKRPEAMVITANTEVPFSQIPQHGVF